MKLLVLLLVLTSVFFTVSFCAETEIGNSAKPAVNAAAVVHSVDSLIDEPYDDLFCDKIKACLEGKAQISYLNVSDIDKLAYSIENRLYPIQIDRDRLRVLALSLGDLKRQDDGKLPDSVVVVSGLRVRRGDLGKEFRKYGQLCKDKVYQFKTLSEALAVLQRNKAQILEQQRERDLLKNEVDFSKFDNYFNDHNTGFNFDELIKINYR